jgi:hypothetical protein
VLGKYPVYYKNQKMKGKQEEAPCARKQLQTNSTSQKHVDTEVDFSKLLHHCILPVLIHVTTGKQGLVLVLQSEFSHRH